MDSKAVIVLKKFMNVLVTTEKRADRALDDAVRISSGGKFKTMLALQSSFINNIKKYSANYDDSSASGRTESRAAIEAFLKKYCGINLNNNDTGSISGRDAGSRMIKDVNNVVADSVASIKKFKLPASSSTWIEGLHVHWPTASSSLEKFIIKGLNTSWIANSLRLIRESYGISFYANHLLSKELFVKFTNNPNDQYSARAGITNYRYDGSKLVAELGLMINLAQAKNIDRKSVSGAVNNGAWMMDGTISHELTHALMASSMDAYNGMVWLPAYITEGLAELVVGADSRLKWGEDDIKLASSNNTGVLKGAFSNISPENRLYLRSYSAGYMLLRYLAKQANYTYPKLPKGIKGNTKRTGITVTSKAKGTFDALYYGDKIKTVTFDAKAKKTTVLANEINNKITVNGTSNKAYGDDGNDTIIIKAGKSNYGFGEEGNDKFYIYGGKNHKVSGGIGDDRIVLSGGSNNTVHGNAGDDVLVVAKNAGAGNIIYGDAGNDTITVNVSKKVKVFGGSGDDIININKGKGHIIDLAAGTNIVSVAAKNVILNQKSKKAADNITVKWSKNIGTLRINSVANAAAKYGDTLAVNGADSTDFDFSKTVINGMDTLALKAKADNGCGIDITGWEKGAFSGIYFGDIYLSHAQINEKAGF